MPILVTDAGIDIPRLPNPNKDEDGAQALSSCPVHLANSCHDPGGANGGQFCRSASKSVTTGMDTSKFRGTTTLKTEVGQAIRSINQVHGISKTSTKKVTLLSAKLRPLVMGNFTPSANEIRINPGSLEDPGATQLAMAHEYGHYLQDEELTDPEQLKRIEELMKVIAKTEAFKFLRDKQAKAKEDKNKEKASYVAYTLNPHELFARAYSQWIATRSDNSKMQKAVAGNIKNYKGSQWQAKDFVPVAKAFDRLFNAKNLLKTKPAPTLKASATPQQLRPELFDFLLTSTRQAFSNPCHNEDDGKFCETDTAEAAQDEYRGRHQPPRNSDRLDALGVEGPNGSTFPSDVYEHPEYYSIGDSKAHKESVAVIRRVKGKPDALVKLYRGAPQGVTHINKGDWVAVSRSYAEQHAYMVREHKLVMESVIGRELYPHEQVHHMNGQRDDNRADNLELWSISQPPGQRVTDKIEWAISYLEQYGYKVIS